MDQAVRLPRVLLADDEAMLRRAIARELRGAFEVVEASDGAEALVLLGRHGDLVAVVSDLDMGPGPSGIAVLDEARRCHPASVRVLASGRAHPDEIASDIASGLIDIFLQKPWPPGHLRSTLQARVQGVRCSIDGEATMQSPTAEPREVDVVLVSTATDETEQGRITPAFLARVRAGDNDAAGELVERFRALLLYRIQRVHDVPEIDAEDVFQDVCERLLLARSRVVKASGFLCTLAKAAAVDYHRKRLSEARTLQSFAIEQACRRPSAGPRDGPLRRLDLRHVLQAAKGRCLELFRGLLLSEKTHREYAEETGVPRGTLGTTISRCMAKVRQILAIPAASGGTSHA